jgi:hypothetical protein
MRRSHHLHASDAWNARGATFAAVGALVGIGLVLAAAAAALAAWLRGTSLVSRSPEAQAALATAVALVDRELAADLELMSMFDQTKQAFVLENAQFLAWRETVAREAPAALAIVDDVYARIPAVEDSMERRGPAGSIPDADLQIVHAWEGDAREAQRQLRAALAPVRLSRWSAVIARLRVRLPAR